MIRACSSTILLSPIIIGPASAMIEALGCITVMLPMVISPFNSHSLHTIAPEAILMLKNRTITTFINIKGKPEKVK